MSQHETKWIAADSGARLDKAVVEKINESRTTVQDWITDGHITVNEVKVKSNYKVQAGDEITVIPKEPEELTAVPEDIPLDIRYEDDDLLVINKARGMVVHPAPGHHRGTIVNALLGIKKNLSSINDEIRPGIVHRIDKDTSGLLVVAKTNEAHQALAEQLQKRTLKRTYIALVHGVIAHNHGTIDAPLGRDKHDRQKMTVTDVNSKEAVTHFSVLTRFNEFTLVECRLETGRTHQIRAHMEYIEYPLVGDPKYGNKKTLPIDGQALHATKLTFDQPTTGEEITVEAELPEDMETLIHNLKH